MTDYYVRPVNGDVVDVSGNKFQLTQINPRVWRNVQ